MMRDLYIVGSGGLGRGLVDALIHDNGDHINEEFNNIYFVDDNTTGEYINGIKVRFNIEDLINITSKCLVINALGEPRIREKIQKKLNLNPHFEFPNYIDSDVKLYNNVHLGTGNIITRGAVLSTNINIGDFNLIHFNSTIGHDVTMNDYNCVYPLVSLSGYTKLGNCNMIGMCSSSLPQSVLNDYVRVGANSLISGEYASNITIVGTPAERIDR